MTKTPTSFPWHVFLLPAFFILHVLNSYYGLIPGKVYATFSFYYFLLSALLLLTGKFLTGSFSKGGIWASGVLVVFYFFGAFYDLLKGLSLPRLLTSYTILLSLILIFIIILLIYLKRNQRSFARGQQYLNILFAIFTCIEIASLLYNIATNARQKNNYANQTVPVLKSLKSQQDTINPDIFFIVFDEYTSSLALKKYYHYDNTGLDSILRTNHFYMAPKAQSNYNSTPLSISSCFNMQYFNRPMEGELSTTKHILQAWYSLEMSQGPKLLAEKGYDVYNFGLSDLDHYPVNTSRYFSEYETLSLYQETLWGRIERDIWWNLNKLNMPALRKSDNKEYTNEANQYIARNLKNLRLTLTALKEQNARPKFVFAHIMMPHPPFYLDQQGNLQDEQTVMGHQYAPALYLNQLVYCNKWIDSLSTAANQPFPRPRVVVIEGDHGFRDSSQIASREKQFMNMNAYYFSDKDYSTLYDNISPVNTFKLIFNKYFHTELVLSKDSTILLR